MCTLSVLVLKQLLLYILVKINNRIWCAQYKKNNKSNVNCGQCSRKEQKCYPEKNKQKMNCSLGSLCRSVQLLSNWVFSEETSHLIPSYGIPIVIIQGPCLLFLHLSSLFWWMVQLMNHSFKGFLFIPKASHRDILT